MATLPVPDVKPCPAEVIKRAHAEGPQTDTGHGAARGVPLSDDDSRTLAAGKPDFKAYLLGGPKVDDFTIPRDVDAGRGTDL